MRPRATDVEACPWCVPTGPGSAGRARGPAARRRRSAEMPIDPTTAGRVGFFTLPTAAGPEMPRAR